MPIGLGTAAIGAAVIGGGVAAYTGSKAAKAQTKAANTADATNRYIFDTQRADFAPYREVGTGALGKLAEMYGVKPSTDGSRYGGFQETPGYRFRVDEAVKAIERSAAARGQLRSGATMDAIQRRVQGEASNEYERFADRLMSLAGVGRDAASSTAAAGSDYGARSTATTMAAGNARASSYANAGNAINQGIQNVAQAYLYNRGFGGGAGAIPTDGWGRPGLY